MKWILKDFYNKNSHILYLVKSPTPIDDTKDSYGVSDRFDYGHRHSMVSIIDEQINGKMKKNIDRKLNLRDGFDKLVK